ncbi:MAG: TetR/AcrR family transcriptional regulator [Treponema sp.]|nr:TetR/AcrR family transcriptional regulator [Treponema sp.]
MAKKRIDRDKIINAFLTCAFEKSAGAVSLADIAALLDVNKASLYNHFSSRDEIYEAAIDLCAQYMAYVHFISEPYNTPQPSIAASFDDALSHIIVQYFRSYELEPLFYMHTFIHSNKFFSKKAADAAQNETQKIADGMTALIVRFYGSVDASLENTQTLQQRAHFFAHALCAQLNEYIVHKKEMIRLNPESGAGSLFALPSDDAALANIVVSATQYWNA